MSRAPDNDGFIPVKVQRMSSTKRRESNRLSAQRSRDRKRKLIESLQAEVASKDKRLKRLTQDRDKLLKENKMLEIELTTVLELYDEVATELNALSVPNLFPTLSI